MKWPFYLLIAVWLIFGVIALILPKKVKGLSKGLTSRLPYWFWGLVCLAFAYFLWQVQALTAAPLVIQIIAILAGIKGLLVIILPKNKLENWLASWLNFSDLVYRILGIIVLLLAYYIFQILV